MLPYECRLKIKNKSTYLSRRMSALFYLPFTYDESRKQNKEQKMTATEVRDLISNDLWQNTNIASVGVDDFKKLDEAAAKLTEAEDKQEFKNACEALLEENHSNSIAIRYLATITGRHPMDDRYIFTVLEQYYEASRWDEVIYLGNKILAFNESSYALKVLADCYETLKDEEKKIETWERLVKLDFEKFESMGTKILIYRHDAFNSWGMDGRAFCLDARYLDKYVFGTWTRREFNAKDLLIRNTAGVVMEEYSCWVLTFPDAHARVSRPTFTKDGVTDEQIQEAA